MAALLIAHDACMCALALPNRRNSHIGELLWEAGGGISWHLCCAGGNANEGTLAMRNSEREAAIILNDHNFPLSYL